MKSIGDVAKVKGIIFDFVGDVKKACDRLEINTTFILRPEITDELKATVENINGFCKNVWAKLEKMGLEVEDSYSYESIEENFIATLKSIKKLCEKNLESIKKEK